MKLDYFQLYPDDAKNCDIFESLMYEYIDEMNEHSHRPLPKQFQKKWIDSIISMQGPYDRHLEICFLQGEPIGFLYGKIDHNDHKGYIKPGYAYIMEFYVKPNYRRSGYATQMFHRMQNLFKNDGATMMYLTADPVTGRPFWERMGFIETDEVNPDNQMIIFEKEID